MQAAGDVHEMYDRSLLVEPREREDQTIVRYVIPGSGGVAAEAGMGGEGGVSGGGGVAHGVAEGVADAWERGGRRFTAMAGALRPGV